jgi:hypothetical protein
MKNKEIRFYDKNIDEPLTKEGLEKRERVLRKMIEERKNKFIKSGLNEYIEKIIEFDSYWDEKKDTHTYTGGNFIIRQDEYKDFIVKYSKGIALTEDDYKLVLEYSGKNMNRISVHRYISGEWEEMIKPIYEDLLIEKRYTELEELNKEIHKDLEKWEISREELERTLEAIKDIKGGDLEIVSNSDFSKEVYMDDEEFEFEEEYVIDETMEQNIEERKEEEEL